ncbi:hypothetical protein [Actinophytocola sp.]|uniref:hypothetical protein n=1 Tax=Actinophytocola sp. TaxID=1872138 RepID=UPI002ED84325
MSRFPVSAGWAITVPLVLWWPIAVTFIELQRPTDRDADLTSLLYLPAGLMWLPLIAGSAAIAWLAGLTLDRRRTPVDRSNAKRRNRGLLCGLGMTIVAPPLFLLLAGM